MARALICLAYLMATHPSMKAWMNKSDHGFAPYLMTIDSICFLYQYGGSYNLSISEYLAAPAWPGAAAAAEAAAAVVA